jgi:hypothetical protein
MSDTSSLERPRQHPEVETYVLPDGSCLLFDNRTEMGHVLNGMGALVWDYCDGSSTLEEIAGEVAGLLPDAHDIEDQIAQLVAKLRGLDLLQPTAHPIRADGHAQDGALGVA